MARHGGPIMEAVTRPEQLSQYSQPERWQPRPPTRHAPDGRPACYLCANKGHIARNCPSAAVAPPLQESQVNSNQVGQGRTFIVNNVSQTGVSLSQETLQPTLQNGACLTVSDEDESNVSSSFEAQLDRAIDNYVKDEQDLVAAIKEPCDTVPRMAIGEKQSEKPTLAKERNVELLQCGNDPKVLPDFPGAKKDPSLDREIRSLDGPGLEIGTKESVQTKRTELQKRLDAENAVGPPRQLKSPRCPSTSNFLKLSLFVIIMMNIARRLIVAIAIYPLICGQRSGKTILKLQSPQPDRYMNRVTEKPVFKMYKLYKENVTRERKRESHNSKKKKKFFKNSGNTEIMPIVAFVSSSTMPYARS